MRSATSLSLLLLAAALVSCGQDTGPDPNDPTRRALLVSFADGFTIPTLEILVTQITALEAATATWAATGAPADRMAAQEAWRTAMDTVERLELAQVGPAGLTLGVMGGVLGGEERRAAIYSWPRNNPCRVDQTTVTGAHADVELLAAEDFGARGMDALEYLLFVEETTNQCSSISSINTDGTWASLEAEIPARRSVHAQTAATLVRREAEGLLARWREDGASQAYRETLVTAGEGSPLYGTLMQGVSAVFGALLYIDASVKDMKVGAPGGFVVECTAPTCPEARESLFANASVAHVQANMEAFAATFRGPDDGTGFDDLLVAVGASELAGRVDVAIDAAVAEANALEGTIPELLAADPNALMPLFTAILDLVNLLKTEVVAVLDIDLSFAPSDDD